MNKTHILSPAKMQNLLCSVLTLTVSLFITPSFADTKECIDLGLPSGMLWATCNVGADNPEDYGLYVCWEENLVESRWGGDWLTPTKAERDELLAYCTYEKVTVNGIKGARYTGPNGNSIFFPFAGRNGGTNAGNGGQYWTSTQHESDANAHWCIVVSDAPDEVNSQPAVHWPLSYFALSVRAVKLGAPKTVDLGLSVRWATCNVDAQEPEEYGGYYSWGEVTEKERYTTATYLYETKPITTDICATEYDVAFTKSNHTLRMPTKAEVDELIEKCAWNRTTSKGIVGYQITGPNGNSIFMPCAGGKGYSGEDYVGSRGYYWSGTNISASSALRLDLNPTTVYTYNGYKFDGRPIRPVAVSASDDTKPEKQICATPSISYANGTITFTCATPGAQYTYSVECGSSKVDGQTTGTVLVDGTITVHVFATAPGYTQSDTATASFDLIGDVDGDGKVTVGDIYQIANQILRK